MEQGGLDNLVEKSPNPGSAQAPEAVPEAAPLQDETQKIIDQLSSTSTESPSKALDSFSKLPEPGSGLAYALIAAAVLLVYLPVLIGLIRHRGTLLLLSFICCSLGLLAVVFSVAGGVFAFLFGATIWGSLWMTGLLFGLAAAIDSMAENRGRKARNAAQRAPIAPRFPT
jgi:hypothetical protein